MSGDSSRPPSLVEEQFGQTVIVESYGKRWGEESLVCAVVVDVDVVIADVVVISAVFDNVVVDVVDVDVVVVNVVVDVDIVVDVDVDAVVKVDEEVVTPQPGAEVSKPSKKSKNEVES